MKTKLTKNDSISAVAKDFDVLVAEFEAFLKREDGHASYFQEWAKENEYDGTTNVFYAWRRWATNFPSVLWISCAFNWRRYQRDFDYWDDMHKEWKAWLKQNLNK